MIVDSDFYAILLRYELHESMENLTEVLYLRIYEERNRVFKLHPRRNLCEIFVALYVIIFLAKGG